MGASIHGANVIRKAKNAVGVGINAPLQSSFHLNAIFFGVHINNVRMKGVLLRIHIGDIFANPAFVEIDLFMGFTRFAEGLRALITKDDLDATVEVGELTQAARKGGVIKTDAAGEDLDIRLETHRRAGAARFTRFRLQAADRRAPFKALLMHLVLPVHRDFHPLREGVHHRHANTVQAARHLVTASAKLAAGMEHGEHRFQGALAGAGVNIGGDAAAVVGHPAGAIGLQGDHDVGAVARQGFIHRVIHHLVNQVVQTAGTGAADVHPRALTHRLQTLKNLDLLGAVGGLNL